MVRFYVDFDVDYKFNVRDYFDLDYSVELPEIVMEEKVETYVNNSVVALEHDFDLIKLNITQNILRVIFKGIISRKPCIFVMLKDILYDYLIPFFKIS